MTRSLLSWQSCIKRFSFCFIVTAGNYQFLRSALFNLSFKFLTLFWAFPICAANPDGSRTVEIWLTSRSGWALRLLNRGRKRTHSQNKRWGANPFPFAVKQSLHSLPSKWHLIWFCCWSLRYPESFQDINSGCCATLARYEGAEIWWAVTLRHSHERAHRQTHTDSYKWLKTSWNNTTGSRFDFTGYTRSAKMVKEIQIGLARVFLRSSQLTHCQFTRCPKHQNKV